MLHLELPPRAPSADAHGREALQMPQLWGSLQPELPPLAAQLCPADRKALQVS